MRIKRGIFVAAGCISLALGCIGVVLPVLPTVPFLLITLYCFSRSSEKLHTWFIGTKLYKNHLESYIKKEGMTLRTKLMIVSTVTLLMTIGFIMMRNAPIGQICLVVVWICHLVYFFGFVKTIMPKAQSVNEINQPIRRKSDDTDHVES